VHHRASILVYPRQDEAGNAIVRDGSRSLELILPPVNDAGEQSILQWTLPVTFPEDLQPIQFQFTWASVMALLGGLLASMWPCLFQLTAYFIPTLAGLSMAQAAQKETAVALRLRVLKTAIAFVAGIVIIYTLAGAAAGFAAQSFGGTSVFETWRRPLSLLAGLVILFMAIRMAVNARAPFVCKMPIFSGLRSKSSGYLGTMFLGLAFATGCTTCFGAAVIIAMLTYVGTTGTALYGALTMFIFSLGVAIPLVLGALAMARVLQLLGRLEKFAPWMALTSSAIMVGFAILLLSDRFMWLSNLIGGGGSFS
jgi:cytochrome c-type biogenesis protein